MKRYTHETQRSNPYWAKQQPFNNLKRSFTPGKSSDNDLAEFQRYINDLMNSVAGRTNGYILTEDDWETVPPLHHAKNPNSTASGVEGWRKSGYDVDENSIIKRNDLVSNLQPYLEEWNNQRVGSSNKGEDFDSYLREIDKLIRADTERLSNIPLAEYKSKFPQMSTMTQKARGLREARKNREQTKGTAYSCCGLILKTHWLTFVGNNGLKLIDPVVPFRLTLLDAETSLAQIH